MRKPKRRFLVPPPILYVAIFLVGVGIDQLVPAWTAPGGPWTAIGIALIAVALALAGWAVWTFRRARTTIDVNATASRLVTGGPFRLSRNPMYVALTLLYAGLALALRQAWSLALLPAVFALLHMVVLRHEEARLRDLFGDAYTTYTARVRRWL